MFTDDWASYKPLRRSYIDHKIINRSAGQYVVGDIYTNTIEGFFGNLKTGMRGVYKKVSPAYLQSYIDDTRGATTLGGKGERCLSSCSAERLAARTQRPS